MTHTSARTCTIAAAGMLVLSALTSTGAVAASTEHDPVTLTLDNIWGGDRVPLMETVLQLFHETYPWITVKNGLKSSDALDKDIAQIAAGSPPDVLMVDRLRLAEFVKQGVLQPLDQFIRQDKLDLGMFYPSEVKSSQYGGRTYVLPMPAASMGLLYYNKGLFSDSGLDANSPPTTWDEMTRAAIRLSRVDAGGKVAVSGGSIDYFPRFKVAQIAYLNGATIFSDDGLSVNYLGERTVEALNWAGDFVKSVPQGGSFNQGTQAMSTQGEWNYFYAKNANPNMDVGIALLPHGPEGKSVTLFGGAWSYGIPVGVKHPLESWLLVKFLTSSEAGAKYFALQQTLPSPVMAWNRDSAYLQKNPYWGIIGQALASMVVPPISPASQRLADADIRWYGTLMKGETDPKSMLLGLQREAEAIVADFKAN